jgi:hypothetical protein
MIIQASLIDKDMIESCVLKVRVVYRSGIRPVKDKPSKMGLGKTRKMRNMSEFVKEICGLKRIQQKIVGDIHDA